VTPSPTPVIDDRDPDATPTPSPTPIIDDKSGGDDGELPKTGDNNDLAIWLSIMAAAIALMIGVAFIGKRRARNK
jgi:LPXTG-motif cell wall-anchored protein